MTLSELKASDAIWITPAVAAPFLKCDPNSLRCKAHENPDGLGFKVLVNKSRVHIHRKEFLNFLGEGA